MNENNFINDYASNSEDKFNGGNRYHEKGNRQENQESIFNVRVKAGSRRTYFFDVKTNRKEDYFIIITERRKRLDDDKAFDKNKIFLYKEDFNKFLKGLSDTIDHVKTELMPDFDFGVFDRENKPYEPSSDERQEGTLGASTSYIKNFDENDKL